MPFPTYVPGAYENSAFSGWDDNAINSDAMMQWRDLRGRGQESYIKQIGMQMDPTQQALIAQLLQGGGGAGMAQAGGMPGGTPFGAGAGAPSMGAGVNPMSGGSAPAWNAGLPPGFSGQQLPPMPPSLYSMTPAQLMQMMGAPGGGMGSPGQGPMGQ